MDIVNVNKFNDSQSIIVFINYFVLFNNYVNLTTKRNIHKCLFIYLLCECDNKLKLTKLPYLFIYNMIVDINSMIHKASVYKLFRFFIYLIIMWIWQ